MISVIVPIYNVEQYLRQCIDSILSQTYTDLEIILVDDGSTDTSGAIADSYGDPRIIVFHTENRGLSAARNLGIENAHGEHLFFIDSDDWIEPNILEFSLSQIGSSDIISFGYTDDYDETALIFHQSVPAVYSGMEAFDAYLKGMIPVVVWNKLYHNKCFSSLRFPTNMICEDLATTYQLLIQSSSVKCINIYGYHHRLREGSLSSNHNQTYITGAWSAIRDEFFYCSTHLNNDYDSILLLSCARTIIKAYVWKNTYTKSIPPIYYEMSSFARTFYPRPIRCHFPLWIKISLFFIRYTHPLIFWIYNKALPVYCFLKRKQMK